MIVEPAKSSDDRISRVTRLSLGQRVIYQHLGLDEVVSVDNQAPDVKLDRWVNHIGQRISG